MFKNFIEIIKNQINKSKSLKTFIVMLIDYFYDYRKVLIGNLTRGPAYIKNLYNSKIIAKPGTLSFNGGIYNPGVIIFDNKILLLAKGQHLPWYKANGKREELFLKGNPVIFIFKVKPFCEIEKKIISSIKGYPKDNNWALEDLRLFHWKNKTMVNHSFIFTDKQNGYIRQSSVSSILSLLDIDDTKIIFFGIPKVDFPVQKIEKNWMYSTRENELYMFYSINPYKVLHMTHEETLTFSTIINKSYDNQLKDPGGFGTMVSFSVNPIDYDEKSWLIIIHQIQPKISGRCYYHWAVLIDKSTLLPIKITSKPIFSGMGARGRTPGIRYISSILKIENEILFFAGEGDVYTTVTRKLISELDVLFTDL